MNTTLCVRRSTVALLLIASGLPLGCRRKAPQAAHSPAGAQDTTALGAQSTGNGQDTGKTAPAWLEHPQVTPGTTVLTALDPHQMSASEVQFGVAPKLSKDVQYQPGIILMEQGDKAIRSVASDGLTWNFDANAPHVSEFENGRIVFATGRAVGRIIGLKRTGETVSAILGPIQLADVIKSGRFVMDQTIDPDKMISYIAPDYPQAPPDSGAGGAPTRTSSLEWPSDDVEETVVLSRVVKGRWIPASMSQTYQDGRRVTYKRRGGVWTDPNLSLVNYRAPRHGGLATLDGAPIVPQGPSLPGMPQRMPQIPNNPVIPRPPITTTGTSPVVNISEGSGALRMQMVGNNTFLGLQYFYNASGMHVDASGLVNFQAPKIRAVLSFQPNGGIDSAGIDIQGAAGISLELAGNSAVDKVVNIHIKKWVPIDISIPLGGPVPLALTFATLFDVNSGFSAKSSLMVASGGYNFSGRVWAGRTANSGFQVAAPSKVTIKDDLAQNVAGLSVGINSFTMAFSIRTLVGLGAFGFNTGVFASVRFGGSLLISPTTAYSCRQATLGTFIDSGIGYQIPGWAAAAINFFLKPFTGAALDAVGTIAPGPTIPVFTYKREMPDHCAG